MMGGAWIITAASGAGEVGLRGRVFQPQIGPMGPGG